MKSTSQARKIMVYKAVCNIKAMQGVKVQNVEFFHTPKMGTVLHSAYIDVVCADGVKRIRVSDHRIHKIDGDNIEFEIACDYIPSKGVYDYRDYQNIKTHINKL